MPYVIAEPCIGVKDTACVDVCPVDVIHPRRDEAVFASASQLSSTQSTALTVAHACPPAPCRRYFCRKISRRSGLISRRSTPTGMQKAKPPRTKLRVTAPPRPLK